MRKILRALGIKKSSVTDDRQDTYVYHPGTGTYMSVAECVLVDYDQVPDELK